jgi:hypothetical protein
MHDRIFSIGAKGIVERWQLWVLKKISYNVDVWSKNKMNLAIKK